MYTLTIEGHWTVIQFDEPEWWPVFWTVERVNFQLASEQPVPHPTASDVSTWTATCSGEQLQPLLDGQGPTTYTVLSYAELPPEE